MWSCSTNWLRLIYIIITWSVKCLLGCTSYRSAIMHEVTFHDNNNSYTILMQFNKPSAVHDQVTTCSIKTQAYNYKSWFMIAYNNIIIISARSNWTYLSLPGWLSPPHRTSATTEQTAVLVLQKFSSSLSTKISLRTCLKSSVSESSNWQQTT